MQEIKQAHSKAGRCKSFISDERVLLATANHPDHLGKDYFRNIADAHVHEAAFGNADIAMVLADAMNQIVELAKEAYRATFPRDLPPVPMNLGEPKEEMAFVRWSIGNCHRLSVRNAWMRRISAAEMHAMETYRHLLECRDESC